MKIPAYAIPRKTPFHLDINGFICQSISPSFISSLSADKMSKFPGKNGENPTVNYLHKILVKSPSVHTLYSTSVVAPIHASSVPSIHTLYDTSVIAPVPYYPSIHHTLQLSLFPSVHCPFCLSVHCALCLSLHLSMHCCSICPSIR